MQVEFAFLADAAQISTDGKLYVLGAGIDQINVPEIPALIVSIFLVVKLGLQPTECDRPHTLEVLEWDPDGKPVIQPLSIPFSASRHPSKPTHQVFVQLLANMVNQRFERPGEFGFYIIVDGIQLKAIPLLVQQIPTPKVQES